MDLPFTPPYDWAAARRLIGAHALPGSEILGEDGSITRLIITPGGPVPITVRLADTSITLEVLDGSDPETVAPTVRHWLDLDLDPEQLERTLAPDPRIGPLISAQPGLRRVGYPNAFEAVIVTVLGQQVSLAAARTFGARLVRTYGTPTATSINFPRPEKLITVDENELQAAVGLTGSRTRTVRAVAAAFADDPDFVRAGPQDDHERDAAAQRLQALPGIGPWTVQYLRMRLLADPDALPASDLVLRRALGGMSAAEVTTAAEVWRPWRSYAVLQLWSTMAWS